MNKPLVESGSGKIVRIRTRNTRGQWIFVTRANSRFIVQCSSDLHLTLRLRVLDIVSPSMLLTVQVQFPLRLLPTRCSTSDSPLRMIPSSTFCSTTTFYNIKIKFFIKNPIYKNTSLPFLWGKRVWAIFTFLNFFSLGQKKKNDARFLFFNERVCSLIIQWSNLMRIHYPEKETQKKIQL